MAKGGVCWFIFIGPLCVDKNAFKIRNFRFWNFYIRDTVFSKYSKNICRSFNSYMERAQQGRNLLISDLEDSEDF
jgi:hypothetical protein